MAAVRRATATAPRFWARNQVPTFAAEINWSHPITRGLLTFYRPGVDLHDVARRFPDLVNQESNPVGPVPTPVGVGWQSTAGSAGLRTNSPLPAIDFSQGLTL